VLFRPSRDPGGGWPALGVAYEKEGVRPSNRQLRWPDHEPKKGLRFRQMRDHHYWVSCQNGM
jgi:hypothetical protein